MAGLDVAGGMMKYVGFAILMKIMLSGDLWMFYFLGFGLAVLVSNIPNVGGAALVLLTIIGATIALGDYQTNVRFANVGTGGDEDGI